MNVPYITYVEFSEFPRKLLRPGDTLMQSDIFLVDYNGRTAILKDFSSRPRWLRLLWCRRSLSREISALSYLRDFEHGIPHLLARVGPYAILMEQIPGKALDQKGGMKPAKSFFERAFSLVESLHRYGIAHGEIYGGNLLIDDDSHPYLLDFASSIRTRTGRLGFLQRFLFRECRELDRFQLTRLKAKYYRNSLSEIEATRLMSPPSSLVLVRLLRLQKIHRCLEKFLRVSKLQSS